MPYLDNSNSNGNRNGNRSPNEIEAGEIGPLLPDPNFNCNKIRGVPQKFCVADPFYTKNQQMYLALKKLNSPGYNLLFEIITIPSEEFFKTLGPSF